MAVGSVHVAQLAPFRRLLPFVILAAILAAFYFAVGRFIDGARTLESLERLDPAWAAAALACAVAKLCTSRVSTASLIFRIFLHFPVLT